MKWSRYSKLFESQRNGWLLFNAASRSFFTVEPDQLAAVQGIMEDPEGFDYSEVPMLYMQLRSMGYLVEDGRDDDLYNIVKMRTLTNLYAPKNLLLTVAITRACNFDCPYCFESNRTGAPMSDEVEDKLVRFIEKFNSPTVGLVWYGGEPLLAWNKIVRITERLQAAGKRLSASMITNGYLLTKDKAARLNDLGISHVQITLDGRQQTHDSRRFLKGGAPTYERILKNIDDVMHTDFKGRISVRVNVDGRNDEEYADVYSMVRRRYGRNFGKRISVYPGFVKGDDHPDSSCFFEPEQQGEFLASMVSSHGISPLSIFPQKVCQSCTLTRRNAYVVGPEGELYKCWDDVGLPEKVVGHIDRFDDWNAALIAEGMVACSYLDSPECKECFYFPICSGGCHRIRQKNLHSDVQHSPCTYFKGNLEKLLELHYERKQAAARQAAEQRQAAQAGQAAQDGVAADLAAADGAGRA